MGLIFAVLGLFIRLAFVAMGLMIRLLIICLRLLFGIRWGRLFPRVRLFRLPHAPRVHPLTLMAQILIFPLVLFAALVSAIATAFRPSAGHTSRGRGSRSASRPRKAEIAVAPCRCPRARGAISARSGVGGPARWSRPLTAAVRVVDSGHEPLYGRSRACGGHRS